MKPVSIKDSYGAVVGIIAILLAVIDYLDKGKNFFSLIFPNDELLNWRFFAFSSIFVGFVVWYIMNSLWQKEFFSHQKTRFEKENLQSELKVLENERLVDIVTGVPNLLSLEKDISKHLKSKRDEKQLQFIFIDLRNFSRINSNYGFMKTNKLLRNIAQGIYQSMRRNEDMYKYPLTGMKKQAEHESFYRIHTGGDEFAFIIEGDQSDAIGFCNRLVPKFKDFSEETKMVLGKHEDISFYAAIVNMSPRDDFSNIINRAKECYRLAKEGKKSFTISWYPFDVEAKFEKNSWKKQNYETARKLFEVILVE